MKRKTRLLLTVTFILVIICGTTLYVSCTPNTAEGFVRRGDTYRDKGELDMAIADYTEAIRLDSNYSEAYYGRAHAYSSKGNKENALNDFTTMIRLDPNNANAYYFRAIIYGEKGDLDKSIADYEAYLKIRPEDKSVEEKLKEAKNAKKSAEFQQAVAEYTEAIRLNPNNADAYFKRGYQYYMKIPEKVPDNTNSQELIDLRKAIVSIFIAPDLDQAIADFEAAVRINRNHADARKYLENARQLRDYWGY